MTVTNTCPFTVTYSTKFIGPAPRAPAADVAGCAAVPAGASAVTAGLGGAAVSSKGSTAVSTPGAAAAAKAKPVVPAAQVPSGTPAAAPAAPATTADSPVAPSGCFYCKPCSGVLEAGQSQDLTVVLAPTGPTGECLGPLSPYVLDRLQILVPYQQQDVVVPLQAAVWPDGVFVAGVKYSSSSGMHSRLQLQAAAVQTAVPAVADPFAAVVAAAAAAVGASTPTAPSTGAASKGKQTAAGPPPTGQQQQALGPGAAAGAGVAAALAAAGHCDLTHSSVELPGPVAPGQTTSVTLEFGAAKSSTGGLPGELTIDDLPAAAKEAGWSIDSLKVAAPAGERKPFVVRYTAPSFEKLKVLQLASAAAGSNVPLSAGQISTQGAFAELGLPLEQMVKLSCAMKGGCLPVPGSLAAAAAPVVGSDGLRRLTVSCKCVVAVPAVTAELATGAAGGAAAVAATVPVAVADKKVAGK